MAFWTFSVGDKWKWEIDVIVLSVSVRRMLYELLTEWETHLPTERGSA
jgi:hypothetical protein